ncbi:hypothetical protein VTP01DRAFT_534 [Rhizomucor pusillus]|uniref:uncharacterized protein n=1 Tax=Rhizomucor pusillus TaxID=4840 RepID=UPI0037449595
MARTVAILAGALAVAAVTYKFRDDVTSNTDSIRRRLGDAKTTLDNVASGAANKSLVDSQSGRQTRSILSESSSYISDRLVPSVKDSWNAHVQNAAHTIINSDLPSRARKLFEENVLSNINKKE